MPEAAAAEGATDTDCPITAILPLSSTMIFCAVLSPSPLTFFSSTAFSVAMMFRSSDGLYVERIVRAVLPPTPDTLISARNNSRSSFAAKP